jgi:hypothetical protein
MLMPSATVLLMVVALATTTSSRAPPRTTAKFEQPVLLGSSRGSGAAAINASCGGGRWWFPAGGYAIDNETLVTTVSLAADGNTCPPTGEPREVVVVSRDAGRSWKSAWFVDSHLLHWNGLLPGPGFCGASGSAVAGGGLLCPEGHNLPTLAPDGTGVLQLPAVLWHVAAGGQLQHTKLQHTIQFRCPRGGRTLPGGWGPGPVQTLGSGGTDMYRIATCNDTQVIMRSLDRGWHWDTISTIPPWTDLYTAGK